MATNHPSSYLFYDLETSGLNPCFDQIVQFAAIRTDLQLRELARYQLLVKLNPDSLPKAAAFLTHQLTIKQLQTEGVAEYQAVQLIHQLLNQPNTINIGYNNLAFDDEWLRFAFYRNLLPPYTHQYANGCYRLDLYPILVNYLLYKPELLNWPNSSINSSLTDKVSLKLADLNQVNQLVNGRAHNAMVDVEITLALARRLAQVPEIWQYLTQRFLKTVDQQSIASLPMPIANYPAALLIDGSLGNKRCFQLPALFLGQHRYYKNQTIWLALETPLAALLPATIQTVDYAKLKLPIYRKRWGETPIILPLTNARCQRHLTNERINTMQLNLQWLTNHITILPNLANYYCADQYPLIPNVDLDAALYLNGFHSAAEVVICQRFHQSILTEKLALIAELPTESLLRRQAARLIARNYPELQAQHQHQWLFTEFNSYLDSLKTGTTQNDYQGRLRPSIAVTLAEITELQQQYISGDWQTALLAELQQQIYQQFKINSN